MHRPDAIPDLSWSVSAGLGDNFTTLSPEQALRKLRHKDLVEETVPVGMMFASKAFVQLLANPIVGPLTHKYVETSSTNFIHVSVMVEAT